MIKIVREHIGFHYLLIEIQLYTLIVLELNIFFKKNLKKSNINDLLTKYLEYTIMNLLCADFIVAFSQNMCLQEKLC